MPKAAVTGVDTYRWVDDDGNVQSAERGDGIDVSDKEFERGVGLGALSKPGTVEAKEAKADAADVPASDKPGVDPDTLWPKTHKEIDELAGAFDFVFDADAKTVEAKAEALAAAGFRPLPDDE